MTTFTPPQEQVLALISAGSTIADAAQSAGVHRNTVHNWLRSSPFHLAFAQARADKAFYWREQAEQLASAAVDTIRAVMADPKTPASVRLKAALSILSLATTPPVEPAPDSTAETVHNSAQAVSGEALPDALLPTFRRASAKIGRNELCPCGSGRKFKRCCAGEPHLPAELLSGAAAN
jgi:hypothetical protein